MLYSVKELSYTSYLQQFGTSAIEVAETMNYAIQKEFGLEIKWSDQDRKFVLQDKETLTQEKVKALFARCHFSGWQPVVSPARDEKKNIIIELSTLPDSNLDSYKNFLSTLPKDMFIKEVTAFSESMLTRLHVIHNGIEQAKTLSLEENQESPHRASLKARTTHEEKQKAKHDARVQKKHEQLQKGRNKPLKPNNKTTVITTANQPEPETPSVDMLLSQQLEDLSMNKE